MTPSGGSVSVLHVHRAEPMLDDKEHAEFMKWRARVDNFMDDSTIQRRSTALQMGSLEKTVSELQVAVQESSDWSKKNHDSLLLVIELCQNMDNARKLADAVTKWAKPFVMVVGFLVAVVVWIKTGKWEL